LNEGCKALSALEIPRMQEQPKSSIDRNVLHSDFEENGLLN